MKSRLLAVTLFFALAALPLYATPLPVANFNLIAKADLSDKGDKGGKGDKGDKGNCDHSGTKGEGGQGACHDSGSRDKPSKH